MTTNEDLTRIEVDQYFPHPPTKLWRALTVPDLMAQWLMPNDFEPIVGHRFTFRGRPVAQTGFSGQIACQVLDLVPHKRLRISWADADNSDATPTTVTWTLQPEGKGTRLFLEHAGFNLDDPTQQLARKFMNGGWRSHVLRRLTKLLPHLHGPAPKLHQPTTACARISHESTTTSWTRTRALPAGKPSSVGELPEGLNRPAGIDAETVPAIGAFAPKPATLRSPTYYDHWAAQYPKVRDQLTAHHDMREVRILVRGSSVALRWANAQHSSSKLSPR